MVKKIKALETTSLALPYQANPGSEWKNEVDFLFKAVIFKLTFKIFLLNMNIPKIIYKTKMDFCNPNIK